MILMRQDKTREEYTILSRISSFDWDEVVVVLCCLELLCEGEILIEDDVVHI